MRAWLKHSLWTLPFICFTVGYWLPYIIFSVPTTSVPDLLGKNIQTALELTSHKNLSLKLLHTQEDPTLPSGTILFQTPSPYRSIRPHQTILVVASCQPTAQIAPLCIGLTAQEATALLKKENLHAPLISVPADARMSDTVIAQKPLAGTPLEQTRLSLYVGKDMHAHVMVPSYANLPVQQVHDFLMLNGLALIADHECSNDLTTCHCTITEQKPLAGSFIDIKKPPLIYVKAKH